MADKSKEPTMAQIDYALDLLWQLGYDEADYDFAEMTRSQVARLIDKLRAEGGE